MAGDMFVETHIPQQKLTAAGILFPVVLSPDPEVADEHDLDQFLAAVAVHKPRLESLLFSSGAVLLRGFPLHSAADFDRVVAAFGYQEFSYLGGAASRTRVVGRVFTANESPPEQKIVFHHEMAHVPEPLSKLFFFCEEEPRSGGETPIALSHLLYERMKEKFPEFVERLEKHGLIYRTFLTDGDNPSFAVGRGWQSTFSTTERSVAEERAAQLGMRLEWKEDGVETIIGPISAVRLDKSRGQNIWFNHMVFFKTGSSNEVAENPLKQITFGDGSPVPFSMIDECLNILEEECVAIPWRKGDILLLDNFAVMHARRTFEPPRRILASMCK